MVALNRARVRPGRQMFGPGGRAKDFLEATARVVVVNKTGTYNEKMGFPGTLYQAFDLKGLATPRGPLVHAIEADLDPDPQRRLEQTLYPLQSQ